MLLNLNLELGYKSPVAYNTYGLALQSLLTKSFILPKVIVVSTFLVPSALLNQVISELFIALESL